MKNYLLFFAVLVISSFTMKSATIQVNDDSILPGQKVYWTSDNEYVMNGFVFVEDGAELHIEPGTVIKGKPGSGAAASALIVAKGGKIFAEGTPTNPIIFTAEVDDVNNPFDLTKDDRGLWGGVIILGKAGINVAGGSEQIEGIPVEDTRGAYGGNDDNDNSGIFRYVSIRHGGSVIGSDNEINGLTMGGVGRGTKIEFVEVFANVDDAFEWFGGTVDTKYLVAAFAGDDSYDYDEGFRGKGQFWFAIQDENIGNSAGEHDGGTTPEDGTPYAIPTIYNATYIGSGINSFNTKNTPFMNIRDNAGGKYYSSIFMEGTGIAVRIEEKGTGENSRKRLEAGDLEFANNIFYNFKDGLASPNEPWTLEHLSGNGNREINPQLVGVSRDNDYILDPRPQSGSPAWTGAKVAPNDGFFTPSDYVGAFGNHNWMVDWTLCGSAGYVSYRNSGNPVGGTIASVETIDWSENPLAITNANVINVFPNPFDVNTNVTFELKNTSPVLIEVYNSMGDRVEMLVNETMMQGTYGFNWNPGNIAKGLYFITMTTNYGRFTQKVVLK